MTITVNPPRFRTPVIPSLAMSELSTPVDLFGDCVLASAAAVPTAKSVTSQGQPKRQRQEGGISPTHDTDSIVGVGSASTAPQEVAGTIAKFREFIKSAQLSPEDTAAIMELVVEAERNRRRAATAGGPPGFQEALKNLVTKVRNGTDYHKRQFMHPRICEEATKECHLEPRVPCLFPFKLTLECIETAAIPDFLDDNTNMNTVAYFRVVEYMGHHWAVLYCYLVWRVIRSYQEMYSFHDDAGGHGAGEECMYSCDLTDMRVAVHQVERAFGVPVASCYTFDKEVTDCNLVQYVDLDDAQYTL